MSCCSLNWSTIGAALGGLAVILGAFAAHGIDGYFAEKYPGQVKTVTGVEVPAAQKYLNDFKTGAQYQMYHAIALIFAAWLATQGESSTATTVAGWAFVVGVALFSGSLYTMTLTGMRWLGAITPLGGVAFIVGWIALAVAGYNLLLGVGTPAALVRANLMLMTALSLAAAIWVAILEREAGTAPT